MTVAAAVAPVPAGTPCPYADVTITGLTGTTHTVWRNWEGNRVVVRGQRRVLFTGAAVSFPDYEAPFGVPVSYQVDVFNSAGAVIDTHTSPTTTLDVTEVWISDPLAPSISCPVVLDGMALSHTEYRRDGAVVPIGGAREPVLSAGTRRAGAGIPLNILCADPAEHVRALSVFQSADPVCVRTPGGYQLPRLAYVTSETVAADYPAGVVPMNGESDLLLTVDLVRGPAAGVVVPERTYADVAASFSTYGDLLAAYPTYLALLRG